MATSLPCVGGYDGPFSLKVFMRRCFDVELRYGQKPTALDSAEHGTSTQLARPICYLACSSHFAIVVYVAAGAEAPALPRHTVSGNPIKAPSLFTTNALHTATRTTAAAVLPLTPPLLPSLFSGAPLRGKHPCLHNSLLLTNRVRRHPVFDNLFTFLGPAATAFVHARCPLVVQFDPTGGGLQVLGPPLVDTAASAVDARADHRKRFNDVTVVSRYARKREHKVVQEEEVPGRTESCGASVPKRPRLETGMTYGRQRERESLCSHPLSTSALLGRVDVPRHALVNGTHKGTLLAPTLLPSEATLEVADWLEELWLRQHPSSRARLITSCLRPAQCRRARRQLQQQQQQQHQDGTNTAAPTVKEATNTVSCPHECEPNANVLHAIFPYSLPRRDSTPSPFLLDHLRQLVVETVHQCASADLRGCALRHTSYLERRCTLFLTQQSNQSSKGHPRQRASPAPVRLEDLMAPVDIVVSYLRDVLGRLTYHRKKSGEESAASCSFWGVDVPSSESVLSAVCEALRCWLGVPASSAEGGFRLSAFLNRVPVASIPWLACLYTDAASTRGRQRRSMLQQRVYLQFAFFLTQHVVPFLVRRSFHVTWASKAGSRVLFFVPLPVWRRLLRNQIRSLRCHPGPTGPTGVSLLPCQLELLDDPSKLLRVATDEHRQQEQGQQGVLVSAVRFLPDKKKLRPIATVGRTHLAVLTTMTRGLRSRYSARYRLAIRLAQDDSCSYAHHFNTGPRKSEVGAPLVAHQERKGATSAAEVLRQALLCLSHGIEEQRRGDVTRQDGEGDNDSRSRDGASPSLPGTLPDLRVNSSPADEYKELRAFHSAMKRLDEQKQQDADHLALHVVRGDAAQCYDRLNQDAVMQAVQQLIRHEHYYLLDFHCLCRAATRAQPCHSPSHDEHGGPASLPILQRKPWRKLVSDADIATGILPGIPAGWVVLEQGVRCGKKGGLCTPQDEYQASASPKDARPVLGRAVCPDDDPRMIEGVAMRHVLSQHVRDHLVTVDGRLYRQHRGVVQGSPVAMLLCDVLLLHVDASLAEILAEHHEPSLQLRRVDDVLVMSSSPVAAQRCWQSMVLGWPEVGYVCHTEKLMRVSAPFHIQQEDSIKTGEENSKGQPVDEGTALVPWCGLLLDPRDLSVRVEWARLSSQLRGIAGAAVTVCRTRCFGSLHGIENALLIATHRLMSVVRLRIPAAAVCRVLNTKARVLQTVYEAALVWAQLVCTVISQALMPLTPLRPAARCRPRCPLEENKRLLPIAPLSTVSSLLRRPMRACEHRLRRMLSQHQQYLQANGSHCSDVTAVDVQVCASTALLCTLRNQRFSSASPSLPISPGAVCACYGGRALWWRLRCVAASLAKQCAFKAHTAARETSTMARTVSAAQLLWPARTENMEEEASDTEGDIDSAPPTCPFTRTAWAATHPR